MSCPLSRPLSPPVPSPPGGSTAPWLPLYRTAHSPKGEGTRPRAGTSVIHPQEEPGSLQELENCLSNGGLSPQQHGSRVFFWGGGLGGASPCALVVKNTGGEQKHALAPTETSRLRCAGASLTSLTLLRQETRNLPVTLFWVWVGVA